MSKIIITYGLPGSGKTYYGKYLSKKGNLIVINMDEHMKDGKYLSIENVLKETIGSRQHISKDIYIDALITTKENLKKVLMGVIGFLKDSPQNKNFYKKIEIVYWDATIDGSRNTCLENTKHRNDGRNVSNTVKNLPFEKIDGMDVETIVCGIDKEITTAFKKRKIWKATGKSISSH